MKLQHSISIESDSDNGPYVTLIMFNEHKTICHFFNSLNIFE